MIEQEGKLVRLDFSEAGWSESPPNAIGYWKTTVPVPDNNKPTILDADAMMRYFEQLSEAPNHAQDKFRFVLGLLLLQKKRLRLEGSRREEDLEFLRLSGTRGEGDFEVRDYQLADEEIQELQSNLTGQLTQEWK